MSRPLLDSTPVGTNTNNGKKSPIYSIPVGTKLPKPMPLTLLTDLPGDPDPDLSLSDLLKKSNSSNDINSRKSKKKKCDEKKKYQKPNKDDSSYPSSGNDSYLSYDSDYRRTRRKRKSNWKKSNKIIHTFNGNVADDSI